MSKTETKPEENKADTSEETKVKEIAEKVESAFPKEDAKTTQPTDTKTTDTKATVPTNEKGTPLWAGKETSGEKKDEKQIRPPSQTDIMLYMAREMHLLRIEQEAFLNKVYTITQKPISPSPSIGIPITSAPITQEQKSDKLRQLENALVEWTNCNPILIEINTTESTMFYVVRFKQFLGSDNFAKISTVCRALGGIYVSEGKQSHINVPRQ